MTKLFFVLGLLLAFGSRALYVEVTGADWLQFAALVVVAALALSGTVITVRSSRQVSRDKAAMDAHGAQLTVDAAAYERARASYEASIANYQREMGYLTARVTNAEARAAHAEAETLRTKLRLVQFETLLLAHDIPVPPETS